MLVHEWHPTALLRMVLLSFPQHPRLMVGKRSPAFRFQLFFLCVGQSKRIIQNPIPTCACPPVQCDLHSAGKSDINLCYTQTSLIFTTIRLCVDRELKPRLSVAELRGNDMIIILFLSPSQRRTPLSAIILCSFHHLPRCSQHT